MMCMHQLCPTHSLTPSLTHCVCVLGAFGSCTPKVSQSEGGREGEREGETVFLAVGDRLGVGGCATGGHDSALAECVFMWWMF